jgi:hypothetical protein
MQIGNAEKDSVFHFIDIDNHVCVWVCFIFIFLVF